MIKFNIQSFNYTWSIFSYQQQKDNHNYKNHMNKLRSTQTSNNIGIQAKSEKTNTSRMDLSKRIYYERLGEFHYRCSMNDLHLILKSEVTKKTSFTSLCLQLPKSHICIKFMFLKDIFLFQESSGFWYLYSPHLQSSYLLIHSIHTI